MTQVEQDAPVQSAAHSPGPRSRCGGRPGRSCCWCRSQTPQRDSPRRCPSRHGACPVHARQWSDGCDGTVPDEGFSTRSNCAGSQLILVVEGDGRVTRRRALGRTKHTRSPKPNPHPCPLVGVENRHWIQQSGHLHMHRAVHKRSDHDLPLAWTMHRVLAASQELGAAHTCMCVGLLHGGCCWVR